MTRNSRRSPSPAVPLLLLLLLSAHTTQAATFTVTSLADSGPGSLRQAVLAANSAAGQDLVDITVSGTITLTSGEIPITDAVFVDGVGAGSITVSGNDLSRIFAVQGADVTLSRLTLTRGRSHFDGGAVFAVGANLTIVDSLISDSRAGLSSPSDGCGGNIALNGGSLRIVNCAVTGGTSESGGESQGGNLCVNGTLSLERSTVSGGSAVQGGGIYFQGQAATIERSTISGNTAGFNGGGVYADVGDVQFLNSTVSGNSAAGDGGGIYSNNQGDGHPGSLVVLRLTTVSNNTATGTGGSIHQNGENGTFELDHAILANGTPNDVGSTPGFYTANYSLIESALVLPTFGANNLLGVDPVLGPLANHGGPTLTHLPLPGSPVINAGDPAIPNPPATDQIGFARIAGAAVDLGSVEVQAALAEVPTLSEWGILVLSTLLLAVGVWRLRA
jgi:predicted outer membrane repeat protein